MGLYPAQGDERVRPLHIIKNRPVVIGGIFLVSFSTYLMTAIMAISPVYLTTLLGIFFCVLQLNYTKGRDSSIIVYSFHVLYSLFFLLGAVVVGSGVKDAFVSCFFGLYYIWADMSLGQIKNEKEFGSILRWYILAFLAYYCIDLIFRIKTMQSSEIPAWIQASPIYMFYMIKEGGIYGDSNAIGVFALVHFSVCYFAFKMKRVKKSVLVLAFVLVVLTASRAALISALFLILLGEFFLGKAVLFQFFIVTVSLFLILVAGNILLVDASFQSKFEIFQKTVGYVDTCSLFQFLFGNGPQSSIEILGLYAHNIWSILLVEYGFIHTVIFVLMIVMTCVDVGRSSIFILIPYLLVSLSFTPIHLQFLFTVLALMKVFKRLNRRNV